MCAGHEGRSHLNLGVDEELFNRLAVAFVQTCVMQTDAECERELEVLIANAADDVLHLKTRGDGVKTLCT